MSKNWLSAAVMCVGLLLFLTAALPVWAVSFDDPEDFGVKRSWSADSLSIPQPLGGMLFNESGDTLYVVGASEDYESALYAVPVSRDPKTNEVSDLGPAAQVSVAFSGKATVAGLDAGWEIGPKGTLFYTYWPANLLGERPGGVSGTETLFDMSTVGVPSSVAGLTFSPYIHDPNTGFGIMQVSAWPGEALYNVRLSPLGGNLFEPANVQLFANLPRSGTGAIQYVPSGPFMGNMMYVNWNYDEVCLLLVDRATGLPIDDATGLPTLGTDNPRIQRFAYELAGAWGLEFDPLTNDFFVSTWGGDPYDTIIQIGGKGLPAPARITSMMRSAAELTIDWYGPVGWTHILEHSGLMFPATWHQVLSIPTAPLVNQRNVTVPGGDKVGFYRVKCVEP